MKSALIIGCGYTGTTLARHLGAAGIAVSGTSTSGAPVPGVAMQRVDLLATDPLDLGAAADGAVVYYMVSTLARSYEEPARPHLAPLRRALAALHPHPIAGLIYLSSTSVYGDRDGDREGYEERAAIMEFDGGLSRAQAEQKAETCHYCRHWCGTRSGSGWCVAVRPAVQRDAAESCEQFQAGEGKA
jgi:nucleoside-diphosphate-sugar epimerase